MKILNDAECKLSHRVRYHFYSGFAYLDADVHCVRSQSAHIPCGDREVKTAKYLINTKRFNDD